VNVHKQEEQQKKEKKETEKKAADAEEEQKKETTEEESSGVSMSMDASGMRADADDFNPFDMGVPMEMEPTPVVNPGYVHPQMMPGYVPPHMNPGYAYMQPTYPVCAGDVGGLCVCV
jgi:hypothetical protein